MEDYEDFDKELENAPKDADPFMIVLPFKRGLKVQWKDKQEEEVNWYDSTQYDFSHTEGRITKDDIDAFLKELYAKVSRVKPTIQKVLDGFMILCFLVGIIVFVFACYFVSGHELDGTRAGVFFSSLVAWTTSLVYLGVVCWCRTKQSKKRVEDLETALRHQQDTIFSQKGAIVCMSELESYITIELMFKYVRIAKYARPEDKDREPHIPSLEVFNCRTFDKITKEDANDKVLIGAVVDFIKPPPKITQSYVSQGSPDPEDKGSHTIHQSEFLTNPLGQTENKGTEEDQVPDSGRPLVNGTTQSTSGGLRTPTPSHNPREDDFLRTGRFPSQSVSKRGTSKVGIDVMGFEKVQTDIK